MPADPHLLKTSLEKLLAEVRGLLGLFEPSLRDLFGNTNINVLKLRAEEADAALRAEPVAVPSAAASREPPSDILKRTLHALLGTRLLARPWIDGAVSEADWHSAWEAIDAAIIELRQAINWEEQDGSELSVVRRGDMEREGLPVVRSEGTEREVAREQLSEPPQEPSK